MRGAGPEAAAGRQQSQLPCEGCPRGRSGRPPDCSAGRRTPGRWAGAAGWLRPPGGTCGSRCRRQYSPGRRRCTWHCMIGKRRPAECWGWPLQSTCPRSSRRPPRPWCRHRRRHCRSAAAGWGCASGMEAARAVRRPSVGSAAAAGQTAGHWHQQAGAPGHSCRRRGRRAHNRGRRRAGRRRRWRGCRRASSAQGVAAGGRQVVALADARRADGQEEVRGRIRQAAHAAAAAVANTAQAAGDAHGIV